MKIVRIMACIWFVIAVVVYGGYRYQVKASTDLTQPTMGSDVDLIEVTCDATDQDLIAGLVAMDEKDGDLSSEILVDTISTFVEKGIANIQYVVFDHDKNFTTYTRKVKFVDYESPRFHLSQPFLYTDNEEVKVSDRLTATDRIDGDISSQIKMIDNSNNSPNTSEYTMVMEVSNHYGDVVSLPVTISHVKEDRQAPRITLSEYLIYLKSGDRFDPLSYVAKVTDYMDETIMSSEVEVNSTVDMKKPGVYEVNYSVVDQESVGYSRLLVVVE